MKKITGFLLTGVSTLFFIGLANGAVVHPLFALIPACGLGVTGLSLLLRDRREGVPIDAVGNERVLRLEQAMAELQVEVDGTQVAIKRLKEERAFLEGLVANRINLPPMRETGSSDQR